MDSRSTRTSEVRVTIFKNTLLYLFVADGLKTCPESDITLSEGYWILPALAIGNKDAPNTGQRRSDN